MFIDTHCHLDDPVLDERLPDVLAAARRAGVGRFIVPGVSPEGWSVIARLAREVPGAHAAFGLHPLHAARFTPELLAALGGYLPQAVAMGEIGLDYSYVDVPWEVQRKSFRAQLNLAVTAGLPVLIHCRRAFKDLLAILREERAGRVGGLMHAFSGSPEVARECLKLGFLIAIAGTVTYANAVRPVEVVRQLPLGSFVLETDAPDLAPEPYRGGRGNEPAYLLETARKVAQIKGITLEEVARVTTVNAERLFQFGTERS